jgi:acylphosphatase
MSRVLLQRNVEYKVKGVNYHRTLSYYGRGYYEKGYLIVEPHQDVKVYVIGYTSDDVEVKIQKFDYNGKQISETEGTLNRGDLIKLLGLD